MKKRIAIITGTRAEYGIFKPLLKAINESKNLELKIIVSGMHLLEEHGMTIDEIKKDGFHIDTIVRMYGKEKGNNTYHSKALGIGIINISKALFKIKPSVVVVFGDRLEALAGALAAATLRIPIAHIHGGDKDDTGHIDEGIRNSISQFAHIHFTATKKHTQRLTRMGEESWRIFRTGALGLDSILNTQSIPKKVLFRNLGIDDNKKTILCIFHPNNLEVKFAGKQMHEIMKAISQLRIQTVVVYPNNDAGSQDIISEIKKYNHLSFVKSFPSLEHDIYINLLKQVDVMIGNSSSGIIETPSLGVPVVNIGIRNSTREHGRNVIFVQPKRKEIANAIKKALYDKKFLTLARRKQDIWGNGTASKKIIMTLNQIKIDRKLLFKLKTY